MSSFAKLGKGVAPATGDGEAQMRNLADETNILCRPSC